MTGAYEEDAGSMELEPWPLAESDIIGGMPQTSGRILWRSADGASEGGIWQITPGIVRDVEKSEMFVVLSGTATVELESGKTLELAPGSVGTFEHGTATVWRVHSTLRKAFVLNDRQ